MLVVGFLSQKSVRSPYCRASNLFSNAANLPPGKGSRELASLSHCSRGKTTSEMSDTYIVCPSYECELRYPFVLKVFVEKFKESKSIEAEGEALRNIDVFLLDTCKGNFHNLRGLGDKDMDHLHPIFH